MAGERVVAFTAGGEPVLVTRHHLPTEGKVGAGPTQAPKNQKISTFAPPNSLQRIAYRRSMASVGKSFPDPGSGQCQAGSAATDIVLASDLPLIGADAAATNAEMLRLLVHLTAGPGAGQWRRILAMDHATKRATISGVDMGFGVITAPWITTPTSSTFYDLYIDCQDCNQVAFKVEYADATTRVLVAVALLDWPPHAITTPFEATRTSRRRLEAPFAVMNTGIVEGALNSGYRLGVDISREVRGMIGAKLYVVGYDPDTEGAGGTGLVDVAGGAC